MMQLIPVDQLDCWEAFDISQSSKGLGTWRWFRIWKVFHGTEIDLRSVWYDGLKIFNRMIKKTRIFEVINEVGFS